MAGSNSTPISLITSARGTVTWNTPPSSALPVRPRACSICLVSSAGPVAGAAATLPPPPSGVPLADNAWRSAVASLIASPWPS